MLTSGFSLCRSRLVEDTLEVAETEVSGRTFPERLNSLEGADDLFDTTFLTGNILDMIFLVSNTIFGP